jgi:prophage antirepressor-like protein
MLFINEKLNAQLTVKTKEEELYFDMYEIAKILEYARPTTAVQDFMRRNAEDLIDDATFVVDPNNAPEWVVNMFLMKSKAVRAKEFQMWVYKEVLPTVRKMGWKAIQQYRVSAALANNYTIPKEELLRLAPEEIVDEVIQEQNNYRQLGYLPASEFIKSSHKQFWAAAVRLGYISKEGEALREGLFCAPKYHNPYLPSGKWFAFTQEVGERIAKAAVSGSTAKRPWESKPSWIKDATGEIRKKRTMVARFSS